MQPVLSSFRLSAAPISCVLYGEGHINETYRVICEDGGWYILQRVNTDVFQTPRQLMRNIELITRHVSARVKDPRETMQLIYARNGDAFAEDETGFWRMFAFTRESVCFERADTPELFAESAVAFGRFFNYLSDFDAGLLYETIPHFHDTPVRFAALTDAIRTDAASRVRLVRREIDAALSYEQFAHTFAEMQTRGELPLRVTHNDTKINNVLFDAHTRKGLCVVDLDTVMPGLIANDFGDAIRFGANTAAEDEPDLDKVHFSLPLYRAYLGAYLNACGERMIPMERETLPIGARMMTFECGIRFLTDYLSGDVYFRVSDPEQNLRRARTQLKLLGEMTAQLDEMNAALRD